MLLTAAVRRRLSAEAVRRAVILREGRGGGARARVSTGASAHARARASGSAVASRRAHARGSAIAPLGAFARAPTTRACATHPIDLLGNLVIPRAAQPPVAEVCVRAAHEQEVRLPTQWTGGGEGGECGGRPRLGHAIRLEARRRASLTMSCRGSVRLPGSPPQPPGVKAYFMSRVCAGLLAVQSERSAGAQLEPFSTSGLVQQPFFSSGLPWPFHLRGGRGGRGGARRA